MYKAISVLLLSVIMLTGTGPIQAQNDIQAEIVFGLDSSEKTKMEQKLNALIQSPDMWYEMWMRSFESESNSSSDTDIPKVEVISLLAYTDNIQVGALWLGDKLQLTPVFFTDQRNPEKNYGISFYFDADGELVAARQENRMNAALRIAGRALPVSNATDFLGLNEIVASYKQALEQKNVDRLRQLFGTDVEIISGTWTIEQGIEKYQYRRQESGEYLSYLKEKIFRPDNKIQIDFSDTDFFRDADNPNLFVIRLIQTWHSSYYSDRGQLFLVVEKREDSWLIKARYWLESDLELHEFYPVEDEFRLAYKPLKLQNIPSLDGRVTAVSPPIFNFRKVSLGTKSSMKSSGSFFTKKRLWLIGGVAAGAAASSAILLTRDGGPGPGIPIPPGRPVAN